MLSRVLVSSFRSARHAAPAKRTDERPSRSRNSPEFVTRSETTALSSGSGAPRGRTAPPRRRRRRPQTYASKAYRGLRTGVVAAFISAPQTPSAHAVASDLPPPDLPSALAASLRARTKGEAKSASPDRTNARKAKSPGPVVFFSLAAWPPHRPPITGFASE